MTTLHRDIYRHIFDLLPISDKRSFLRTCHDIAELSELMPEIVSRFQKTLTKSKSFKSGLFSGFYFPLYKFTVELIHDGHRVPDKYFVDENIILYKYPNIYQKIAARGDLAFLKRLEARYPHHFMDFNIIAVVMGAINADNFDVLSWAVDEKKCVLYCDVMTTAAKHGNLEIVKWLNDRHCAIDNSAIQTASGAGHLELVKYFSRKENRVVHYVGCNAARNGHHKIVDYYYSTFPSSIFDIAEGAVLGGHIDIIEFVCGNTRVLRKFSGTRHVHMLKWLIDNGLYSYTIPGVEYMASYGNLECLQELISRNYEVRFYKVFDGAVLSKNIKLIRWLYDIACPFGKSAIRLATQINSLEIVRLLLSWNCQVDEDACAHAAEYADLEVLKLFYDYGCKLDDKVINNAAMNGNLEIIIWARQRGCGWSEKTLRKAVSSNNLMIIKWLRGIHRDACDLRLGEIDVCPWDETFCVRAIDEQQVDILRFGVEHGCHFGDMAYEHGMASESDFIVRYVKSLASKS